MINPPDTRRILAILPIQAGTAASLMLCLLAGGCVAAVGAGTVALTDKTPVDHVVSLVSGKDCSLVRRQRGLAYCVEDEITLPVRVHCYPTLGEVNCYAAPDPFPGSQRQLGSDQPTTVTAR